MFGMDRLTEMEAFANVVDQGGFTDAAKKMGISKSAVSKHVSSLEARLGARLSASHPAASLRMVPAGVGAVTLLLLPAASVSVWGVATLLAVWGMLNTALPVVWMGWLTRNAPQEAEEAGGLMVAAIQGAILLGGALGGLLLDGFGIGATFLGAAALCAAALVVIGRGPARPQV